MYCWFSGIYNGKFNDERVELSDIFDIEHVKVYKIPRTHANTKTFVSVDYSHRNIHVWLNIERNS